MDSFYSIDFAAEFDVPVPGTFSKPVRQITFYKHGNKDEVVSKMCLFFEF